MNRPSFRTAHRGVLPSTPRALASLTVGAVALGLAFTASAKDIPALPANSAPASPAAKAKAKHHWFEVGVASWYGQEFQGKRTAAGERFDMNGMTCAHPSLPMGTWLKVTNLKNRHSAYVRVNDRGPVLEGRIVDLSFAAAKVLGLKGLGKVKLESVPAGDPGLIDGLMAQVRMPILFGPSAR